MLMDPPLDGAHFLSETIASTSLSQPRTMMFGVGISIHVINTTNRTRAICFIGAGAEFTP